MRFKRIIALLLAFVMTGALLAGCADIDVEGILEDVQQILEEETAAEEQQSVPDDSGNSGPEENNEEEASVSETNEAEEPAPEESGPAIDENGEYTSKDEVALYIHTYGKLPSNFITKNEARDLGWDGGSLEPYAPGKSIGGDYFGNYEGLLPEKRGRKYTECDIDTKGRSSRGEKRIVFSNDGLIYYTDDHYSSFTLLYGEE